QIARPHDAQTVVGLVDRSLRVAAPARVTVHQRWRHPGHWRDDRHVEARLREQPELIAVKDTGHVLFPGIALGDDEQFHALRRLSSARAAVHAAIVLTRPSSSAVGGDAIRRASLSRLPTLRSTSKAVRTVRCARRAIDDRDPVNLMMRPASAAIAVSCPLHTLTLSKPST